MYVFQIPKYITFLLLLNYNISYVKCLCITQEYRQPLQKEIYDVPQPQSLHTI